MKRYQCSWPGCYVMVSEPRSFCERHKDAGERMKAQKLADARKPMTPYDGADRPNQGLYNTRAWKKLCKYAKTKQPFCAICGSENNLEVHHIAPPKGDPALFFDADNVTVICHNCHLRLTRQEIERLKTV